MTSSCRVKSAISQISGYKDKLLSAKDVAAEAPRDTKAALISKIYTAYSNRLRHGWCHGL